MHRSFFRSFAATVAFLLLASASSARVISYSPYSDQTSYPAYQHRMNRFFVLLETPTNSFGPGGPIMSPLPWYGAPQGDLVLYDSQDEEEPRVIFPQDGKPASFNLAAVRERHVFLGAPIDLRVTEILIQTTSTFGGRNPDRLPIFLLSVDAGVTWKHLLLPSMTSTQLLQWFTDNGGPFTRGRHSPVRTGTDEYPFVLAVPGGVYAVKRDGSTQLLASTSVTDPNRILIGSDDSGRRFLYRSAPDMLSIVSLDASTQVVGPIEADAMYEGWITRNGGVYVERSRQTRALLLYRNGKGTEIAAPYPGITDPMGFFAIPTTDYNGAWMIQRGPGRPTTLLRHTATVHAAEGELIKHWEDITSPEVEALHAGTSGTSLLIQVHRPRPQADQRLFIDPALAVWHIGEPAPQAFDELFLNETQTKGFVHLDVDRLAAGAPFVFDSGLRSAGMPGGPVMSPAPPSAGGSDVVQEWGVVRASLKQRLVLPGMARTVGAFGSYWLSDVVIQNPLAEPQNVSITYVPTGDGPAVAAVFQKTITLEPREIRLISDSLHTLFGLTEGGGAFFLEPEHGITATSRTYSKSDAGTYGFGMNAIDLYAAISPRFPVSFAGAFPGSNFRTNLVITDTSGRGTEAALVAVGDSGVMGSSEELVSAPRLGQKQFNFLADTMRLLPGEDGALLLKPTRGTAIASVIAIDNRTNDPTYFPPDLPAPVVRTIPAIGHVDGAFGSRYRSDLYLYNPASQTRTVTLQANMWDVSQPPVNLTLTLLPNEARIIKDVLFTAFGKTGIARLRYQSNSGDSVGVRVTSRTYTIDERGGTYGFLMPPLNNFQAASSGDTLEILGAIGDSRFRTNVGLVELSAFATGGTASAKIEIVNEKGVVIDSFNVNVPIAGGMQLNDIFRARNLGHGPAVSLIRITSFSGMIGAYATLNDNGTNDPTYLAANLAATQ